MCRHYAQGVAKQRSPKWPLEVHGVPQSGETREDLGGDLDNDINEEKTEHVERKNMQEVGVIADNSLKRTVHGHTNERKHLDPCQITFGKCVHGHGSLVLLSVVPPHAYRYNEVAMTSRLVGAHNQKRLGWMLAATRGEYTRRTSSQRVLSVQGALA